jgi:RNA polymerase sigma-70 factor, ECF subfamily
MGIVWLQSANPAAAALLFNQPPVTRVRGACRTGNNMTVSQVIGLTRPKMSMLPDNKARFERLALPHLDAAYNLARWLTRNSEDAADVVQDAYMRALRYFDSFDGDDREEAKVWLLAIVRNTCFTWMRKNRRPEMVEMDEDFDDSGAGLNEVDSRRNEPEARLLAAADASMLDQAIEALPSGYREVIVMRELEDLSYKEIAAISGIAIGTVMSRLARGRQLLRKTLTKLDHTA